MKQAMFKGVTLALVCGLLPAILGCEPEGTSRSRQERLYAAENMRLKAQIERLEKEHAKQLAEKETLLEQCLEDKNALQKRLDQETIRMVEDSAITTLIEQLQQLDQENKQLKAELEKLKVAAGEKP